MRWSTPMFVGISLAVAIAVASAAGRTDGEASPQELTADEAREIARGAYFYVLPLVENYNTMYQFALNAGGADFKGPVNQIHNVDRVFGPQDKGVVTPNSDTPYSFLVMDLRTEPLVVTLPPIEADRYYSLQLVDLYTHNIDYVGTRRDGNGGGDFLIAGPGWSGEKPPGITRVVRSPTQLMYSQIRTQLKDRADIDNVKKIQAGYRVRPLSAYLNQPPPRAAPAIDFPPISREQVQPKLFEYGNFLLQFAPALPWEGELRDRLARIGIGPGKPWPPEMAPEVEAAFEQGVADAQKAIVDRRAQTTSSAGLFGTPEQMRGKYLERAGAAEAALYGNDVEEALYPAYFTDADGQPIDTAQFSYTMTFPPRAVAAGRGVLVRHDLRRQDPLPRGELDRSLSDQLGHAPVTQAQCRRLGDCLHPARIPRCGAGIELAPGAQGPGIRDASALLAESRSARRTLGPTAAATGREHHATRRAKRGLDRRAFLRAGHSDPAAEALGDLEAGSGRSRSACRPPRAQHQRAGDQRLRRAAPLPEGPSGVAGGGARLSVTLVLSEVAAALPVTALNIRHPTITSARERS